jgi:farnesyl-diphosphate farnesyltransferase
VSVATPSGKTAAAENFPVGSWLVRAELRPHIRIFYRFARTADDIADNPDLAPAEKLRRLDRMASVLEGDPARDAPEAAAMRQSLAATGVPAEHCHALLDAFRLDATKRCYRDWDDLMAYCRLSAMPVGRHVLDLHGEARESWAFSDPLCAALQVLNHLQDCGEDRRLLDRVYIPLADLEAAGTDVTALNSWQTGTALRRVLDSLLDRTEALCAAARGLPGAVRDRRLRCETAVIVDLAHRLVRELRSRDPLAERVRLGPLEVARAFVTGIAGGLRAPAVA